MSNSELSIFGWAALFVARICELRIIKNIKIINTGERIAVTDLLGNMMRNVRIDE